MKKICQNELRYSFCGYIRSISAIQVLNLSLKNRLYFRNSLGRILYHKHLVSWNVYRVVAEVFSELELKGISFIAVNSDYFIIDINKVKEL